MKFGILGYLVLLLSSTYMKIKKIGWTTFLISTDGISLLTDPLQMKEEGLNIPKTEADICIFTNKPEGKYDDKIGPDKRAKIMEIFTPGEYEVGGLMIRRDFNEEFYIIDEKNLRVVYMGGVSKGFDPEKTKNLGDVDALILPVGDGDSFMDYDTLEKVISYIDPAILIPCAYKEEGKKSTGIKTKEEFIKHFGYANATDEGFVNLARKRVEEEQKSVQVIFLK